MRSKEEILESAEDESIDSPDGYSETTVRKAMDEYAREISIGFANWIGENSYRDCEKGWYKYYTQTKEFANFTMSTPVYEYFTTEQLYNLFIIDSKKE
jgi:hypothetical protein